MSQFPNHPRPAPFPFYFAFALIILTTLVLLCKTERSDRTQFLIVKENPCYFTQICRTLAQKRRRLLQTSLTGDVSTLYCVKVQSSHNTDQGVKRNWMPPLNMCYSKEEKPLNTEREIFFGLYSNSVADAKHKQKLLA